MGVQVAIDFPPDDWIERVLKPAVDKGVGRATLVLSTRIAESMPGAGAAVVGKTGTGRNVYRASSPGSPPGVRTNRLRGSITNEKVRQLVWVAGTSLSGEYPGITAKGKKNKPYALFLEYGTSKTPARPFIRPSLERSKGRMVSEFVSTVRRELGNG